MISPRGSRLNFLPPILFIILHGAAGGVSSPSAEEPSAASAGLAAYLEDRSADAITSWRPLVESADAGGALLYRYYRALENVDGDAGEIQRIRKRARRRLEEEMEAGGGPVECYYLGVLTDRDEDRTALTARCYEKFKTLEESDDPERVFYLANLTGDDQQRAQDRMRILKRAIGMMTPSGGPPSIWLRSASEALGVELTSSGHPEEALAVYERALEKLPDNIDLLESRGDCLWRMNRLDDAESVLREVLKRDPGRAGAWTDLGFVLRDREKCGEAIDCFRKALELDHDDANANNGLGLCLKDSKDLPGALAAFRDAARLSPAWASPHQNLAETLDQSGDSDGALKEARTTLQMAPESWAGRSLLADLLDRKGDVEGAIRTYKEAAASIAEADVAWAALGQLLARRNRASEAVEPLTRAVAIDPNYAKWRQDLGSALEALERFDEAESEYRKAIELDPNNPDYSGYLGSLLESRGRHEEALKAYARAEELLPGYAYVVDQTALITGQMKGPEGLLAYLEPRLQRFKDNARILRRAGVAYDQVGRLDRSEEVLRQATAANPGFDLAFDSLAIVVNEAGRRDEAIRIVEEGLKHSADSAMLTFRLGTLVDLDGRPAEAEKLLSRALEIDPKWATAWNSLGVVRDHLGNTEEAIGAFRKAAEVDPSFALAKMNLARMYRKLGRTEDAVRAFREVVILQPKDGDAWGLLAEQLHKQEKFGEALDAAASGLQADPNAASCANVRADALASLGREAEAIEAYHRAQDIEGNDEYPFRREAEIDHGHQEFLREIEVVDRCLARFPKSSYMIRQKGLALYTMRRYPEALASYRAALALDDKDWIAVSGVGDVAFRLEKLEEARAAYARATEINPKFAAGFAALGDVLEKLGRGPEAITAYRKAVELSPRPAYAATLARLLHQAGKAQEAESLLRGAVERSGKGAGEAPVKVSDLNVLRRALADLYEATSRPVKAIPLLQEVVSGDPKDLHVRRQLALAMRSAGRIEDAARELEAALEMDGDDQEALSMLRALPRGSAEVEAFLKRIRPSPLAIETPDVSAILERFRPSTPEYASFLNRQSQVEWSHYQVQVREGGLLTETLHEILWPLDPSGADDLGEYRISWVPEREQVEVHVARTRLPDGRVLDAAPEAYHRVSPSDTSTKNVYSDSQILVISLPQVSPGASIEVQYTKRMKTTLTGGNWWSAWGFQGKTPSFGSTYVVQVPRGAPLQFDAGPGAPKPEVREDGEWVTYAWRAHDLPGIPKEVSSPPLNDRRFFVRATSYASWDEVAAWYHGLIRNQYDLDEETRSEIGRWTESAADPREKVKRLYYHLEDSVRYVAVELGIASYQPHRASETLRNQYGDCKDRGTLFIAMLKAAGIKALPALLATRARGGILHGAPSPGQFDHFIVYLPDLAAPGASDSDGGDRGLFVDATAEHYDLGDLPAVDQGAEAFVIENGKGRFIRVPVSRPDDNRRLLKRTIVVAADGGASVTDDATAHGYYASLLRDYLALYDQQSTKELVEKSVHLDFPGATDIRYEFTDVGTPGGVPRDHETFRVPGLARQVGKSSIISVDFLNSLKLLLPVSPAAERTSDYEADVPFVVEEILDLSLEGGRTFAEWPEPVDLDSPHARFRMTFEPDPPGAPTHLVVRGGFTLKDRDVPVSDYASFASTVERTLASSQLVFLIH